MTDKQKISELERRLAILERVMTVTPTQIVFDRTVMAKGIVNADRVYTKRSGTFVELTT